MTSTRRSVAGFALVAAGILAVVGIFVALLLSGVAFEWAFVLSAVAFVVAFIAIGSAEEGFLRLACAVAAAGWILIALTSVIAENPGIPGLVGEVGALVGGVAGGMFSYRGRRFGGRADALFLGAMVITGCYLIGLLIGPVPGVLAIWVAVVWGVDLLIAGVAVLRRW